MGATKFNGGMLKLAVNLAMLRWSKGPDMTVGPDRVVDDAVELNQLGWKVWELSHDFVTHEDKINDLVECAGEILRNYSWDRVQPLHAQVIQNPDMTLDLSITDLNQYKLDIL